jgi:hypothetical protein
VKIVIRTKNYFRFTVVGGNFLGHFFVAHQGDHHDETQDYCENKKTQVFYLEFLETEAVHGYYYHQCGDSELETKQTEYFANKSQSYF